MKVYLDFVGCRLNQAEIEAMAAGFQDAGHGLAAGPAEADLIVLNTCAVTGAAARESRQRLRGLHAANPNARLAPVGCWVTLAPAEAATQPGVWQTFDNFHKNNLVPSAASSFISLTSPISFDLPGSRLRTRLFVKAQDGCDNKCAFCITRLARGAARSRSLAEIVEEINGAVVGGVKEIVLTGVHLGAYGHDRGDREGLLHLVQAVLRDTDVPRLRLSSLEPWDLSPEFFDLWAGEGRGRLCRHLHLPLQSGCAETLRRMARRTTPERFAALVAAARERIPEAAISTDVIAGFPGETEREFETTLEFVQAMAFSGLHVFQYSQREGTPAARMRGQVPGRLRHERARRLRETGETLARDYRARFVGRTLPVLWEATAAAGPEGFHWQGYTDNYLRVSRTSPDMLWNNISPAQLVALNDNGLTAAPGAAA